MNGNHHPHSGLFRHFRHDLPASIVVFFVALPLCLGIALASGAPLFSGIIAGILGGIVVGSISNSALGVSGPAAGLTVIVLNAIATLGSFQAFLAAVLLAGAIQLLLGYARAGVIAYYFPSSVIKGMLAAIGIIIILKQIPHAIGYDANPEGDLSFLQANGENTFTAMIRMIEAVTPGAILVCLMSLGIMLLWENGSVKKEGLLRYIQGPLVAVVAGVLYQVITGRYFPDLALHPDQLVKVPLAEDVGGFEGLFMFPDFSSIMRAEVWIAAVTIAVVASLETMLSVEATDKLDPRKRLTNRNRELVAQGTANVLAGLIGGLPVTQVIVRSSANIHSGARTRLSTILHGILLLLCVATIPFVLNMIPLAVLAAILFVVGFKLARPATFREMYRLGWQQFLPFAVTIAGVVTTDLLKGIAMGMGVAIVLLLRESFRNSHFLHIENQNGNRFIKMTLAEEVTFLNKGAILRELNNIPKGTRVTIDITKSVSIDYDVREIIDNFMKSAKSRNIAVRILTEAHTPVNGSVRTEVPEVVNN